MEKKDKLKLILMTILGVIIWIGILWGSYWVVKTFSYWIFYEDMVQETIRQLVKPEFLKQLN